MVLKLFNPFLEEPVDDKRSAFLFSVLLSRLTLKLNKAACKDEDRLVQDEKPS
jgi:hypothetical protein